MSESRLIDLETKFSHQENAIEELQQAMHAQYLIIEKLEKSVKLLTEQIRTIAESENQIGPASEKPPHY